MVEPLNATKLEKLLIGEVSGVDDPANESPGWVVMKAKDAPAGADVLVVPSASDDEATVTMKERLRGWLLGREDADEVNASELNAALDAREGALIEKVVEAVSKSVTPAQAAPAPAAEAPVVVATPAVEATPALTIEAVTKAIEEIVEPYNEILEKILDRVKASEDALATTARKSIDGQEDGAKPVEKSKDDLSSAIVKALQNPGQGAPKFAEEG